MCGIVGVFGVEDPSKILLLALHALQHRGQEGAGMATTDGNEIFYQKGIGLVSSLKANLKGFAGIGHTRYSTTGKTEVKNLQPIVISGVKFKFAISHNGNIVNFFSLRSKLEDLGAVFTTDSDTEVIPHLILHSKGDFEERLKHALENILGAWSCVMLTTNSLYAFTDPWGFRPLSLGKIGRGYIIASETCSFDIVGAEFIRELDPGEIVKISQEGVKSEKIKDLPRKARCIFELIYFSRPDSFVFGRDVWKVRINLGKALARECPADADIVVPVPDSGLFAAMGYSEESGIPYAYGFVRDHYTGRTFIEPDGTGRKQDIRIKLNPIRGIVSGKRVVLVDDSIVRGNTSRSIVKLLKDAGAREVHLRISSPPFKFPCYYGIDTPSKSELIANSLSVEEIRKFLGCDSLGYLSVEGMLKAAGGDENLFCTACFTGDYPVNPEDKEYIIQLRLFRFSC